MPQRVFEELVMPHLDAAYNYARWLTGNAAEAEDVVQDACVRAIRYLSSLRGDDARGWLLAIVRNAWFSRASRRLSAVPLDEHAQAVDGRADTTLGPEALLVQRDTVEHVRSALDRLPADFREVLVLRELEGMSYKEIAAVTRVPIGTVMSRLSRARDRLAAELNPAGVPSGRTT